MTGDLAAFIAARLDDDERIALAAAWPEPPDLVTRVDSVTAARHVLRHSPARVLADVAAKRAVLAYAAAPVVRTTPADPCPWPEVTVIDGRPHVWTIDGHRDITAEWQAWAAPREEPAHPELLRALAAPYADHPDYRDEWRP